MITNKFKNSTHKQPLYKKIQKTINPAQHTLPKKTIPPGNAHTKTLKQTQVNPTIHALHTKVKAAHPGKQ